MTDDGPSIWQVSDGRAGNAAQVRAIASALQENERWTQITEIRGQGRRSEPIILSPRAPWTWMPGARWPFPLAALPVVQRDLFQPPWPMLWIAAGRRSAPYTRLIKRLSGGSTFTVQMLDPKCDPAEFDLLVVPEHDDLSGPNVIQTIGSPSYFAEDAIKQAKADYQPLATGSGKIVIVILGGDSKTHNFTDEAAISLLQQLDTVLTAGWALRLTTSRRTPPHIVERFRTFAEASGSDFWAGPQDGRNPYLGWLIHADAAIVSEDSANMLCDAAWHGLPIHIARLEGGSAKFDRLHQSLIDRGAARWFDGPLEQWMYEPLREADRVAGIIAQALCDRDPA